MGCCKSSPAPAESPENHAKEGGDKIDGKACPRVEDTSNVVKPKQELLADSRADTDDDDDDDIDIAGSNEEFVPVVKQEDALNPDNRLPDVKLPRKSEVSHTTEKVQVTENYIAAQLTPGGQQASESDHSMPTAGESRDPVVAERDLAQRDERHEIKGYIATLLAKAARRAPESDHSMLEVCEVAKGTLAVVKGFTQTEEEHGIKMYIATLLATAAQHEPNRDPSMPEPLEQTKSASVAETTKEECETKKYVSALLARAVPRALMRGIDLDTAATSTVAIEEHSQPDDEHWIKREQVAQIEEAHEINNCDCPATAEPRSSMVGQSEPKSRNMDITTNAASAIAVAQTDGGDEVRRYDPALPTTAVSRASIKEQPEPHAQSIDITTNAKSVIAVEAHDARIEEGHGAGRYASALLATTGPQASMEGLFEPPVKSGDMTSEAKPARVMKKQFAQQEMECGIERDVAALPAIGVALPATAGRRASENGQPEDQGNSIDTSTDAIKPQVASTGQGRGPAGRAKRIVKKKKPIDAVSAKQQPESAKEHDEDNAPTPTQANASKTDVPEVERRQAMEEKQKEAAQTEKQHVDRSYDAALPATAESQVLMMESFARPVGSSDMIRAEQPKRATEKQSARKKRQGRIEKATPATVPAIAATAPAIPATVLAIPATVPAIPIAAPPTTVPAATVPAALPATAGPRASMNGQPEDQGNGTDLSSDAIKPQVASTGTVQRPAGRAKRIVKKKKPADAVNADQQSEYRPAVNADQQSEYAREGIDAPVLRQATR
eukprot:TRINITY_DN2361_c0_g1_i6.p1 TRINITY_DN2361_c0_g1~~TRINITY_DN2361_c0_g1_i6.p1  ORF type:complete len:782 (-),score=164.50 TRINITY_DN2361_c0_g1_i6:311-2656(-)